MPPMPPVHPRMWLAPAMAALLLLVSTAPALAHAGSVAFWRVVLDAADARSEILLSLDDVARLAPAIDTGAGDVPVERLGALREAVLPHFMLIAGGAAVPSSLTGARVLPSGLLEVTVAHRTANAPGPLRVRSTFHALTDASHRVVTRVERRDASEAFVLTAEAPEQDVPVAMHASSSAPGALAMVRLGIAHILTGYDHLVFLACLLVPGGTWRSRVAIVSAFTVAHSLTLVLAAMRVLTPPARFVEPAIAVSIAYVAIGNLLIAPRAGAAGGVPGPAARWQAAFVFGLIHGFGFAGMLGLLDLPVGQWLGAVLAFNVGVEVGQLAVVALALPLIVLVARSPWHRRVVQSTSVLVLGLAVVWFVERLQ